MVCVCVCVCVCFADPRRAKSRRAKTYFLCQDLMRSADNENARERDRGAASHLHRFHLIEFDNFGLAHALDSYIIS